MEILNQNKTTFKKLSELLEEFNKVGIKVILLKGSHLAPLVYQDIGLRPMADIDLMVKKEDLIQAEKIMSELGYLFKGNKSQEWIRENKHHINYIYTEKDIMVEIHWHIASKDHPLRIRILDTGIIERWWKRAQAIDFLGSKALILCPEDLLCHLCLHFFKHRSMSGSFNSKGAFKQLYDIFQTLKHYRDEINWGRLKSEAEQYRVDHLIYMTLFIVMEIFGDHDNILHNAVSGLPSEILDNDIVRLIHKRILIEDDLAVVPGPIIQSLVAHTFHDKVKSFLRHIFPHLDFISKRYSVPLSSKKLYFYYFIRPLNLLFKYAKIVLKIRQIKEDVIFKSWMDTKD